MLVTWLGHAQLFVNAADRTLLMDPWFAEPVFGGAWFRYPPAPYPDASTIPRPDFLLLSHTHTDHSGPRTLAQLPKDTRTLVMPFASGAMKRRLERAGYTNVEWLEPWETRQVAKGLKITFVPHDRGWEVSSMVVEADGVRLYHGNDNPLSVEGYREVVRRLGPIDLAWLPFAGASSYPTGFDGDEATLLSRCAQKKKEGLQRFLDGLEGLRPKEAAPFASSWALLESSELWKNYLDRPTAEEVLAQAMPKAAEVDCHLLRLEPGDQWSPETGVLPKHLCDGWSSDAESVRRYAAQERDRVVASIASVRGKVSVRNERFSEVLEAWFSTMLSKTAETTRDLQMSAGFVADGLGAWNVTFAPGSAPRLTVGLKGDEDETITLSAEEFWAVLIGPSTWEDLWYGYRMRVAKRPGAGYYRAFWEMLLNFDAEALSTSLRARFNP